jgi:hypothetical protein
LVGEAEERERVMLAGPERKKKVDVLPGLVRPRTKVASIIASNSC